MRMENIDQSLDSNQNHCEPTVNLPKPGAVRYHSATLTLVGANFEHIFIHPTLAFFLFQDTRTYQMIGIGNMLAFPNVHCLWPMTLVF